MWLIPLKTRKHKERICSLNLRKIHALTLSLENRCGVQEHRSGYLGDPFLVCSPTSAGCQHRNVEEKLETEEKLPCDICITSSWANLWEVSSAPLGLWTLRSWGFLSVGQWRPNILLPWIPSSVLYCVKSTFICLFHALCYSACVKVVIKFLFATLTTS